MQTETDEQIIKNAGANLSIIYPFSMVKTVLLTNSEAQTEGDIADSIDTAIHRRVSKNKYKNNLLVPLSVFIELGTTYSGRGAWVAQLKNRMHESSQWLLFFYDVLFLSCRIAPS
jgi:hypothetical protein